VSGLLAFWGDAQLGINQASISVSRSAFADRPAGGPAHSETRGAVVADRIEMFDRRAKTS
jgi:hypothetical protein